MNLGEILGAALKERAAPDDSLLWFALTDLTASHYGFHPDEVLETLPEIVADLAAQGGSIFRPLETRHGFATLALMIAHRLLGTDAESAPLLDMPLH